MAAEAQAQERSGPRGFWSGTITFGLVSVPVDLFPAVRSSRVPLRMLGPEGQLLQRRYYCSADDRALEWDDIVRGYAWEDGSFTVVTDEELANLAPRKSRDIDLRSFVPRNAIPRELLERPYVLAPAGDSTKAYHLLAQTMEQTGRAGIATFVMRGKEYLAAIFAETGLLRAVTMRFAEELRTPVDIGLPKSQRASAKHRREMEAALAELTAKQLDEALLRDDDARRLLDLAERKRKAERDLVEVEEHREEEPESAEVIDIMRVLKQRMGMETGARRGPARASSERGRNGGAKHGDGRHRPSGARRALATKSKKELYEQAQTLGVPGRSAMSKDQLIEAIRAAS